MNKKTRRLLLISNSTLHGSGYLDHAEAEIRDFLGDVKRVLFVPYALYESRQVCRNGAGTFSEDGI